MGRFMCGGVGLREFASVVLSTPGGTMASRFLTLLGWKHALTGDKGIPFQQVLSPGGRTGLD